MRKRSRRRDHAPPSSRRGGYIGYRFATAAALARLGAENPPALIRAWRPWVDGQMREGATPESSAKHIAGVEHDRARYSSHPPPSSSLRQGLRSLRDPETRSSRTLRGRPGAGESRTSKKGIPYTVCRHGMKIQTLIFPLTSFNARTAAAWAKKHDFRLLKIEETSQSIRIRQNPVELSLKRPRGPRPS